MKQFLYFIFTSMVSAIFCLGCYPQAKVPLETIRYDAASTNGKRSLIIFLPGKGDSVTVFQNQGLVDAVRERGLPIDMIAVNAHIGYYANWSILIRLKEDVIKRVKSGQYEQIWLVGDSMGAYGSISYARQYPDDIKGVVLLGPFLGDEELIEEIRRSGGLNSWDPGDTTSPTRESWDRSIWVWFKKYQVLSKQQPKIYLGFGRDDRFAYAQEYLALLMPPDHVIAIDGGHDWKTWKEIWLHFLDKKIFSEKTPQSGMKEWR